LPQEYAEALGALKCADGAALPSAFPDTDKAVAECEGNSACVAGVGFRAGFDYVLLGHLEKLDDRFETRFKLVNTHDFASRKTFGTRFSGTLLGLSQAIKEYAPALCHELNSGWTDPSKNAETEAADLSLDDEAAPAASDAPAPIVEAGSDHCARKLDTKQKDKAMSLFREGKKQMDAGQTEQALALFEQAHCEYPAPALRRAVSEAQLKLGWCDEAGVSAQLWRDESTGKEQTAADAWLAQLRTSCATVDVTTVPADASFSVDGDRRPLSDGHWAGKLLVGIHLLSAEKRGFRRQETRVKVLAGSSVHLTISLDPEAPGAPAPQPAPAPPPVVAAPPVVASPAAVSPSASAPAPTPRAPAPPPVAAAAPRSEVTSTQAAAPPVAGRPAAKQQPEPPARQQQAAARPAASEAPRSTLKLRWEPLVPAGVAVVALTVAIAEGALTRQCPTVVFTPNDAYNATLCVNSHAIAADVSWALAGAGAVTAGVLWLVLRNQPVMKETHPVKLSVAGNGLVLSGQF
jgi:hypothetical protein